MMKTFVLTLNSEQITEYLLYNLKKIFKTHPGSEPVSLRIIDNTTGIQKILELKNYKVKPDINFLDKIMSLLEE